MGWKTRRGRPYYYRARREGERVRSAYVGNGPEAELAELLDALKRRARAELAAGWREERAGLDAADRAGASASAAVDLVVGLTLESAGFRRHNRGEWRRSRMGSMAKLPAFQGRPYPAGATREEIVDVMTRASEGDESAMPRVRELFEADPSGMLQVAGGNLSERIERAIVATMAGKNLAWPIAVDLKMEEIRSELAGPDPTPIERLLAERAALCWLEVHALDLRHAHTSGLTFAQAEHKEKLRDRASRRYLAALKALAQVRKLGVVAFQVNIGAQQVNIGEEGRGRSATKFNSVEGGCIAPDPSGR